MSRRVNSTTENLSDEDFKRNETVKDSFAKSVRRQRDENYHQRAFKLLGPRHQKLIEHYTNSRYGHQGDERDDFIVNEIRNGKISFAFEGMNKFPRSLVDILRHDITHLDLSMNKIRDFSFLRGFKNLSSLIVDGNTNMDMDTLPSNDKLELFYANKCNIEFPRSFIFRVSVAFKSLKYFSMMCNPVLKQQCLRHVWEGSEHRTRMFAIFMNPNLQHFNDEKVSDGQRAHSKSFHSYLGPVDCKLTNTKTLLDTDDVWKILPLHLQKTTVELLELQAQDEEDNLEKMLSKFSVSGYFLNFEFNNGFEKKCASNRQSRSPASSVNIDMTDKNISFLAPSSQLI